MKDILWNENYSKFGYVSTHIYWKTATPIYFYTFYATTTKLSSYNRPHDPQTIWYLSYKKLTGNCSWINLSRCQKSQWRNHCKHHEFGFLDLLPNQVVPKVCPGSSASIRRCQPDLSGWCGSISGPGISSRHMMQPKKNKRNASS